MSRKDPLLLTPGPLTTSRTVKAAMLHDWGSRDEAFVAMNRRVCDRLIELVGGRDSHVAVPIQGSGTFAVEAMLGTFVPRHGRILVLVNGAYGERSVAICRTIGRDVVVYKTAEHEPPRLAEVMRRLSEDPAITHVAMVHCETTSGILNPVEGVADVVAEADRRLLIDSVSGFGALPVDASRMRFDALACSANKCLQGVPGLAFVLCREAALAETALRAPSVSLDLYAQWRSMQKDGQWRFTPPTHVMAALQRALEEHAAEGGVNGRRRRYEQNCQVLVDGMRQIGFRPLLPAASQAPIIVTFHMPKAPGFDFGRFYEGLKQKGYLIYPGKLRDAESFRIGCIGDLNVGDMRGVLSAVDQTLRDMGVDLTLAADRAAAYFGGTR
jgi:2-aminoethylphosphonate-pyruvate transaminase